jgi:MFS family permease
MKLLEKSGDISNPKRALSIVFFVILLDLIGFGIIIPVLPFYVRSFGVSDIAIGLLAASYSLMQFISAPFLGRLSDAWGRRPVLTISLLGSSIAWIFFGIADEIGSYSITWGLMILFSARMFAGAMGGNISTANAYIADVTTEKERAKYLGYIGAAFSVGFIIGPAIGGFLATGYVIEAVDSILPAIIPITPYSLPSFGAGLLSLLGMILCILYLPESNRPRTVEKQKNTLEDILGPLRNYSIRGVVIVSLGGAIAFSGVTVMFIPFIADVYGYGAVAAGMVLTYIGVISAVSHGVISPKLIEKYSPINVAIFSSVGLMLSMVLLPFCSMIPNVNFIDQGLISLLGVLGLLAVSNACFHVALSTLISFAASEDAQGVSFGIFQSSGSLGRTMGPPLMAVLYTIAIWSPFIVGAIVFIPLVVVLTKLPYNRGIKSNA